ALAHGGILSHVLQQLLVVDLPAEQAAGPPGDAAAAGARFAAEGNRQSCRDGAWRRLPAAVSLEAVEWRFAQVVCCFRRRPVAERQIVHTNTPFSAVAAATADR